MYKPPIAIGVSYLIFTFGYIFSVGFYHVGELAILLTVYLSLLAFYLRPSLLQKVQIPNDAISLKFILTLVLIINIAVVGARLGDSSQTNWAFFSLADRILAFIALVVAFTLLLKNFPAKFIPHRFVLLIIVALIIRVFSILSAPNPTIDVFYILKDGPKQILQGANPYELNYPAPYGVYIPKIIYVYGPLTPFVFLPSVALLNDPRYTLIAADLISLLVILMLAKLLKIPQQYAQLSALIFFYHPFFPFMTEQAWLEPVITAFTFSATYFLVKSPKKPWGGVFLGSILAIKSVYALPLLVYLKNTKSKALNYIAAAIVPVALTLPFLLANAPLFLERTQIYVTDPGAISNNLAPTNISLSVSAVILKYTGIVIPTLVTFALGILISLVVLLFKKPNFAFAPLSLFLVFMTLFMFGPFVFLNYFAYLGNLLILTIIFFIARERK
ncbi:MAG: hypothetical protein WD988_03805 [Candidatus Curtissbacteria bacterium]